MQSLEHVGMTVFERGRGGPELEEFKQKLLTDLTLYFKTFLGHENHPSPEIRRWTGRAYKGLGMSYSMLGRHAEAEEAHRSALGIYERLAAETPDSAIYRHDLACAHCLLGDVLGAQGKSEDAESAYRAAANLYRSLHHAEEINVQVWYNFGVTCHNLGRRLSLDGNAQKALEWHDAAIDVLNQLHGRLPENEPTKVTLAYAHAMRANSLSLLRRHSEALIEWDLALKIHGKGDPLTQVLRARTLAHCGEHRGAVNAADAIGSTGSPSPDVYVNVSCVYGVAIAAVDKDLTQSTDQRQRVKDEYIAAALHWLAKAKEAGYFDSEQRVKDLAADDDLAPLRSSAAFQSFLAGLQKPSTQSK
jgi:tetratricopeptide (TPR) repeat protein